MFERYAPVIRIASLGLAALVLLQLGLVAARRDPLAGLAIPTAGSRLNPAATEHPASTNSTSTPAAQQKPAELPAATQAQVDHITRSGIFGAAPKPSVMPMALLGIAGRDAFVRAPNGQTGLVRQGEEFGGIKLLQIGTNRVLIEHEGQQKELAMFSGFGGQPLLSTGKETAP